MEILSTLFSQQNRKIGLLIPDVVISEKHTDTLEITEHPVETGAPVADHAYMKPAELVMSVGFSAGGSLLDFYDTTSSGYHLGLSPAETYQQLRDLQRSCQPFEVVTGKRIYRNMLIRVIDVTTDKDSENVLKASLTLREVIISAVRKKYVAEKADMQNGVSTASVQNSGAKSVRPAGNQVANRITGG
ncbi:hypothetical protein J2125_000915 [Erwinia toletana]|uniref:Dit-like phage tail protein N-terminal domain-containing protein n=1 Tax=Winslowiella toletana TaxID=92490 RepID=A0ABS4P4Z7_9GAMM|nr:hypothetical protein [Winslowiella toletana]MBP2167723.1 hypothetical protein [Winslowiella toletana]